MNTCLEPDTPGANMVSDFSFSMSYTADSTVTYTCDNGYYFDTGSYESSYTIACESTLNWQAFNLNCIYGERRQG